MLSKTEIRSFIDSLESTKSSLTLQIKMMNIIKKIETKNHTSL